MDEFYGETVREGRQVNIYGQPQNICGCPLLLFVGNNIFI